MRHFCIRQFARNVLKSRSKKGAGIRHGISALSVERMNAYDNTNRLSRELSVGRYLLYNWRFAGVLYRFVPKRGSLRPNPQNRRFPDWTPDTACNVPDSLTWFEYRVAALRASGALIPRHRCQLDRERNDATLRPRRGPCCPPEKPQGRLILGGRSGS